MHSSSSLRVVDASSKPVASQLATKAFLKFSHLADQRLSKISRVSCPGPRNEVAVLNVDGNNLSTLGGVEAYARLIQVAG